MTKASCRKPLDQSLVGVLTHLAIGLDAVLEAIELPACVTDLDAGLADMDGDDFTHGSETAKKAEKETPAVSD